MRVLTIDLASRFSAAMIWDSQSGFCHQFDSWGKTTFEFVNEVIQSAIDFGVDIIVFEDVPYGLSKQFMIKPVLRLQGIFIHALGINNLINSSLFLSPATWQRTFEGVFKGGTNGAAAAALELGYTPPNMLEIHAAEIPAKGKERAKVRAQLKKASTDYVDAFLMCKWALTFSSREEMLDKSGVQEISI